MKVILFFLFGFTLISCNSTQKHKESLSETKQLVETPKHLDSEKKEIKYDTLLCNKRFLIIGNSAMKLDVIASKSSSEIRKSRGDTLFHDSQTTILGDREYTTWVYVKYRSSYRFNQFKVDPVLKSRFKLPDLSSVEAPFCNYLNAKEWKAMVKSECLKQGVNFAGHFTIVEWGCGMMCQNMCIVDRLTGKVYFPDIPDNHTDGYYGVSYRSDSRMIVTNSAILEDYPGYYLAEFDLYPEIYEWKDSFSFRLE